MREEHQDRALLLRLTPYGERDAVVSLWARQAGRLSLFARGARSHSPRARLRLARFSLLSLRWQERRSGAMGALTDAEPVLWWEDAAASLQAFRAFNVLWELVERLEGEGSPDPAFFDAVVRCCDFMAAHAREGEALAVALWRVQWLLLERAGWATPFPAETCPQDRRRWVWSPEGGLLGADQLAAHDLSLPLTPAMLDVLMAIAARRRPALTPELIAGLDAFFERLWAYHLGSPLRSLLHAPVDAKGEGFRPVRVAESVREG